MAFSSLSRPLDLQVVTFGCRLNSYESEVMLDHARAQGYRRICGEVFRHNRPMLQMANELGFATEPPEDGSETSQVVLAL